MNRFFAATAVFATLGALSAANAADLPLKARRKPPPAPVWWASAETLAWSVKSTPLPPLLTTFAPGSLSATTGSGGALGVPGTTVLSPDHLGYGVFPGGRFTLGHWLDYDPRFGLEASGFGLGSRSAGYSDVSGGTPPFRIPFNNVSPAALGFPPGSSSFVLADPGFAAGSQFVKSSLQFWGVEGNGLYRVYSKDTLSVSVMAGVRYLDLREGLSIVSTESLLTGLGTYVGTDNFSTRNQFVGGQVGVKAQQQFGQFDGSVLAKVALGDNYQTVSINGNSSVTGFGLPTGVTPGGIFTQNTNIGQQSRNQFAVVPEVQLQLGYKVTSAIRIFVGYDFLYINNVVRPGNQIDTTLNFSGNPAIAGVSPATLMGAARPAPLINGSEFWAQGVKFGASYTF